MPRGVPTMVLKPIYAALALLSVHIFKSYYLLMNQDTHYSTLLHAFPYLYCELTEKPLSSMLTTSQDFTIECNLTGRNSPTQSSGLQYFWGQEFWVIKEGCICCIFASFYCMPKREHLWNTEKYFLFHFESSSRSRDNQILNFQMFKCHELGSKHSLAVMKFGQFM